MAYHLPLIEEPRPLLWRGIVPGAVAGLHALALLAAAEFAARPPELARPLQKLSVRLLEATLAPTETEPSKPQFPPPARAPASKAAPAPAHATITAPTDVASAPIHPVEPQPASRQTETAPTSQAPITAARFDADYLQNPPPVYPPMSRRLKEEGGVLLRVRVSAQGMALDVEIEQSSGSPRLDEAARSAVAQWRFIPARQGSEAIESSVRVPLAFNLDT